MNVLNFAVTKVLLDRDRPDADPADVTRYAVLAAFVPGAAGLVMPFVAEQNIPAGKPTHTPTGSPNPTPAAGAVSPGLLTPGVMPASNGANAVTTRLDSVMGTLTAQGAKVEGVEQTLTEVKNSIATILAMLAGSAVAAPAGAGLGATTGQSSARAGQKVG